MLAVSDAQAQPLRTALMDPDTFAGPEAELAFARTASAGARSVRLVLRWSVVATAPLVGDAADPDNAGYDWSAFDTQVRLARTAGLDPIVCVTHAPRWARDVAAGGPATTWPRPADLAAFAAAAARRYASQGVRIWQVWNEPNARSHLNPQFAGARMVAPSHYRRMVAAFADAVRGVDPGFVVVAGGLAPFGHRAADIHVVAPLRFLRALLCVSRTGRAVCRARVPIDAWAQNPYTNGGPDRHASARDDVSIGDLPEVRQVLDAAMRTGSLESRRRVELWVTEFAWDTNTPDPLGVPLGLHARWVAESLYRMWSAGVTLATWWRLRDDPLIRTPYQSGLWARGGPSLTSDRPKPSMTAFRFPFVAYRTTRGVFVWGRTPSERPGRALVERRSNGRWRPVATVRTDGGGVFRSTLPIPRTGVLRVRLQGTDEPSRPFSLVQPAARRVFPFGCGGAIRCPRR
jgi:hypothetical protein